VVFEDHIHCIVLTEAVLRTPVIKKHCLL